MKPAPIPLIVLMALALGSTASAADGHIPGTRVFTVATAGNVVLVGFSSSRGSMGSFRLMSIYGQKMTCEGRFRYVTASRGRARFDCTSGESGIARIEAGHGLSGEGSGESSLGAVHILYGRPLDEINARMRFPENSMLVHQEDGLALVRRTARGTTTGSTASSHAGDID